MKFLTGGYHHPFIPISNSHIVPKYATSPPSKLWFMSGVEHERGDDFRNPTNAAAVRGSIDYLELQVDYDRFFSNGKSTTLGIYREYVYIVG